MLEVIVPIIKDTASVDAEVEITREERKSES